MLNFDTKNVIKFYSDDELLAICVPADYHGEGINFFTGAKFSQQLAQMTRPAGYKIEAHRHLLHAREIYYTSEALFIRKGRICIDLYNKNMEYKGSFEAKSGDVILLVSGGHGFEMVEDCDMVEIKQGPYAGDLDKEKFAGVLSSQRYKASGKL